MIFPLPPDIEAEFEKWLDSEPEEFGFGFKVHELITHAERNVARRAFLHAYNAARAPFVVVATEMKAHLQDGCACCHTKDWAQALIQEHAP
jgi:uncharacterized protein YecE (DUF72 family)